MTTLTQLIEQHCPDGVEYVKLGDVAEYSSLRVDSADLNANTFVGVDNLLKDRGGKTLSEHGPNTKRSTKYQVGDVLIGNIRPYLRKIWHATNEGGCSGDVLAIRPLKTNSRFLYWVLFDDEFWHHNDSFSRGGKMPRGDKAAILAYQFPLPPREVQDAIVERLDAFAALIESLDSEIALREKRFEYFREQLLTFDESDDVEYVKLGEPLSLKAGRHIKASEISNERSETHRYLCVGGNGVRGFVSAHNQQGAYAVIGRQGALCGNVQWFSGDFYATEHAVVVTPKKGVCGRFMFHQLVEMNLRQYATKSAQPGLSVNKLKELPIPLPSLDVQQGIADKLDTMQALIDNLKNERELRKTQFEYYREKLLTFNS